MTCAAFSSLVLIMHTRLKMFFIYFLMFEMSVNENDLSSWFLTDLQVLWPADTHWDKSTGLFQVGVFFIVP